MGYIFHITLIKGKTKLKVAPDTEEGYDKMGDSKRYFAPLGLAAIGALFGIGHFGGLHDTLFSSDNETKITTSSYYSSSESTGYGSEISFRGHNTNSDGYIYKGTITLTRVTSGIQESFYHFNKSGTDYVATSKNGPYYRLAHRMTINYIDYKY